MQGYRVALPLALLLPLLALTCSDEEDGHGPLPTGQAATGQPTAAGGSGGSAQGGASAGGAGGHFLSGGFGGEGLTPNLGELPVLDAPDTVCVPTSAMPMEVIPPGNPPAFDRLEPLDGGRWMASGVEFPTGFITFATDGSDASPAAVNIAPNFSFAASEGSTVGLVGHNGTALLYQRFDATDSSVSGTSTLASTSPAGVAIGGGDGQSLVVWAEGTTLRARGVSAGGALAGPAFDLSTTSIDGSASAAIVRIATGFAVVWTGRIDDEYATWFATTSTTAVLTAPVKTISTSTRHEVIAIDAASWGYALLLAADLPTRVAVSVVIDDEGVVLGSGYKLLGTVDAYDIAVQGDGVGVTARRASGEIEFRSLDFNAQPVGPWVCLDGPNPDIYSRAGIHAADGEGYAIVYRTAENGVALIEVDALGSPDR